MCQDDLMIRTMNSVQGSGSRIFQTKISRLIHKKLVYKPIKRIIIIWIFEEYLLVKQYKKVVMMLKKNVTWRKKVEA